MANPVEKQQTVKLVTGMLAKKTRASRGFTLIEILVVLTIIGITLGFALISFGDFGSSRRMTADVEQFKQLITLVQQQAILESTPYGIHIKSNGYAVLRFKPPTHWEVIPSNPLFKEKTFPNGLLAQLDNPTSKIQSMIILHPSGNISPFRLTFQSTKSTKKLMLIGDYNGAIRQETQP